MFDFGMHDPVDASPGSESLARATWTQEKPFGRRYLIEKKDRAFLLEDNEANGFVASEYLEHYGFRDVVWRRSLKDAQADLTDIVDGVFDVVLLDVMLPDGTSVEFLRRIKDGDCPAPVGFYTAKSTLEDQAFYVSLGCDFVFAKPLLIDEFFVAMDNLMAP